MAAELMPIGTAEMASDHRTFAQIADDLSAYEETLAMIEAESPSEEITAEDLARQSAEVQMSLNRIGAELMTKTDSIAGVLRRLESETAFLKAEQDRIYQRRKAYERTQEWLERYVVSVMRERGLKSLKTASNTLSLRSSDAVVFTDEAAVPMKYKRATVVLPERLWNVAKQVLSDEEMQAVRHEVECQRAPIKKAIKAGAEVPGADLEFRESLQVR